MGGGKLPPRKWADLIVFATDLRGRGRGAAEEDRFRMAVSTDSQSRPSQHRLPRAAAFASVGSRCATKGRT